MCNSVTQSVLQAVGNMVRHSDVFYHGMKQAGRKRYCTFPQLLVVLCSHILATWTYFYQLCAFEGRHYQAAGATMQRQWWSMSKVCILCSRQWPQAGGQYPPMTAVLYALSLHMPCCMALRQFGVPLRCALPWLGPCFAEAFAPSPWSWRENPCQRGRSVPPSAIKPRKDW